MLSRIKAAAGLRIEMDTKGTTWKGNTRFSEQVVAFAITLLPCGGARGTFEAMRRYPSSRLIYSYLQVLFGKEKLVKNHANPMKTVCSMMPPFSHFSRRDIGAPHWCEREAYGRLQEMALHITAITEYVMHYACSERSDGPLVDYNEFLQHIRECIVFEKQEDGTYTAISGSTGGHSSDASEKQRLQLSVRIAYEAVMKGTTIAGRKHGCRRTRERDTRRLGLQFLRRIPAEVMDALVVRLSTAIRGIFRDKTYSDQFELEMTKLLRKVDSNFEGISVKIYAMGTHRVKENVPLASPDACDDHYKFNPVRLS